MRAHLRVRSVRKFFCGAVSWERCIFCERLPETALELGGRVGDKLAEEGGFVVGRDALLQRAKSASYRVAG